MHWWLSVPGILALLFLLLARLRIGIQTAFGGDTVTMDLSLGPFHSRLLPGRSKPAKAAENPPAAQKAPSEKKGGGRIPKPTLADFRSAADALMPSFKRALRRTRRSIRVRPLDLSITLGGQRDPASAAELYGTLHMAVWTMMPPLEQLLVIPDPHIHLGIDFDAPSTVMNGKAGVSIRIGTLIAVGAGVGFPALKWFLRFLRQHKKEQGAPAQKAVPAA